MSYFADLTPKRRTTLVIGGVLWLASLVWLVQLVRTPPAQWSLPLAIVMTTLGALSSAAVVVEMFRSLFRVTAGWADREHFRYVVLVFVVFAVIQNTGILVAMSSYGVHAF